MLLKATKVDGIYTADPKKDPTATRFDQITYHECLTRQLKVMDQAAFSLAMERKVPIVVFNTKVPGNIARVIRGENVGTRSRAWLRAGANKRKENPMPSDDILLECEEMMEKSTEHLKSEFRGIRTGRASTTLVEHLKVDYYGTRPICAPSRPCRCRSPTRS